MAVVNQQRHRGRRAGVHRVRPVAGLGRHGENRLSGRVGQVGAESERPRERARR